MTETPVRDAASGTRLAETSPGDVTEAELVELENPRLRAIAIRVARQVELAVEKVAANSDQPQQFPLTPDADSLEQLLAERFATLQPRKRAIAAANAIERINAPAVVRARRFGDLAAVDLQSAVAVEQQAAALTFPPELRFPASDLGPELGPGPPNFSPMTRLELRIHRVTCLDETDGFLGSEAGSDEIDLGGTRVDATGQTAKIAAFGVGTFEKDNDVVVFSPLRSFTTFSLTAGSVFPKSYFVTLVLAEIDFGGLAEFLNKLVPKVKALVTSALSTAIGTAVGSAGGPVGAAIGAAVGLVVGLLFDFLSSTWADDVFPAKTVFTQIPSLTSRFSGGHTDSPEKTVTYSGHGGKYQLVYDWRMLP